MSFAADSLAREIGVELTEKERKLITRVMASGSDQDIQKAMNQLRTSTGGMRVLNELKDRGAPYLKKFGGPVLAFAFLSWSAKKGAAGEGAHPELDGLLGAADNAFYEAMWADIWEPVVKKQVGRSYTFLSDWLGLPDEKPGGRARRQMDAWFKGEGLFD